MKRPSLFTVLGIALVGILLAIILLPGIAGLIEGDFGYVSWELDQVWHNTNNITLSQALKDIYAWSCWRIGISKLPLSYLIYTTDKVNKELSKLPPLKG